MFHKRERDIKLALKAIARQRVVAITKDGTLFVELAPPDEEWFDVAVRTCHLRGWVEIVERARPHGKLSFEDGQPVFPNTIVLKPTYRLTEGGWLILRRSHAWTIATFWVALVLGIAGTLATLWTGNKI